MPYILVEDFRGGLDARRINVTAAPGSLVTLTNAHITRGGEIEKKTRVCRTGDTTYKHYWVSSLWWSDLCVWVGCGKLNYFCSGYAFNKLFRLQHPSGKR